MAKEILCPICGATYNLGEDQLGKKVRCKKCEHPFTAGGKEHEKKNDPDDEDDGISTDAKGGKKGKKPKEDKPAPKTKSLEEQARKKTAPPPKTPVTSIVLGSIGFVVLVSCCGGGSYAFYKMKQGWNRAAAQMQNNQARPNQAGNGWGNPNPNPFINPPGVPQKLPPANVDEALEALRDADVGRRREATTWLMRNGVNAGQQPNVAKALDVALHDQDDQVRGNAAQALRTWGTAENVPSLIRCLETKDRPTWEPAVDALVHLKDARALPALAGLLDDNGMRTKAIVAFRLWGKTAQPVLVKYAFSPDDWLRSQVQIILRLNYLTPDTKVAEQALVELKSADQRRCDKALEWLADEGRRNSPARADVKERSAVAQALTPFIREPNEATRNLAFRALKLWATKDSVVPLTDFLVEKAADQQRWRLDAQCQLAIQTLGELGDERGAAAIVLYLGNDPLGRTPQDALKAIGKKAEPAVIGQINNPNQKIRLACRDLLRTFGTKDEVIVAQIILDLAAAEAPRRNAAVEILETLKPIEARRAAVSKALNPILEDNDANVRGLGFRAAKVWGTKENVPALLLQVADGNIFVKDQRHQAMFALAEIKDERGVWPIAMRMTDAFDGGAATQAIKAMGPMAEKELVAHLGEADARQRDCAWKGLIQVGTKQSLPAMEKAIREEKDRNVLNTANTAYAVVKARP